MPKEQKQSFIKGAAILSITTLAVKILGIVFSIPLANTISTQGMSYYYTAYDIFAMFFILSTAGIPLAVSRMVGTAYSHNGRKEMQKIFKVALFLFIVLGSVCSLIMVAFAGEIATIMGNPNAKYSIMALAPTVFFISITSAFRGYFQGMSNMIPTGTSQLLEAVVKTIIGIGLAVYIINATGSDEYASVGAIIGVSIGAGCSTLYLILYKVRMNKREKTLISEDNSYTEETRVILKNLVAFAIPIMIGSCFLNLLDNVDMAIMMERLKNGAGFSEEQAEGARGLFGHARKFFDLPTAFVTPLSTSLLPILSVAVAKNSLEDIKKFMNLSIRVMLLISLPATFAMTIFAYPISDLLLFNNPTAAIGTAPILAIMSVSIVFNSTVFTTNTILQSFGKTAIPVKNMAIGGAIKIVISYITIGNSEINVLGAAISTVFAYSIIVFLNLLSIKKYAPKWDGYWKSAKGSLIASIVMSVLSYGFFVGLDMFISQKIAMVLTVMFASVVYLVCAFVFKAVKYEDLKVIPKGHILIKIFKLKPTEKAIED